MLLGKSASAKGFADNPFDWSGNDRFWALNAIGLNVPESGPNLNANPKSTADVSPRPAHTAPSFEPYGNALLYLNTAFTGRIENERRDGEST